MALLKLCRRRSTASALVMAATLLALVGCTLLDGLRTTRRSYAFSHRVHVEQELGCTDCHLAAETAAEPGMPVVNACKLCHAELDKEKPPERKVESLFEGAKFRAVGRSKVGPEIVFPHLRHVQAGLECTTCHAALPGNEDALELQAASMDTCVQCHTERKVTTDCAACHPTITAGEKPASHDSLWTRRHGSVCRAGAERTADRCTLCHQETDCASCHTTNPPANHTNQWRRVGHGITAQLDRSTCMTCHQESTCVTCHSEFKPPTHAGTWGGRRASHCLTCHDPLQGEGCSTCHPGTPSHALATPKPAWHTPAMNCRQCHLPGGVLPPMPHVDDGSNCNRCHE